ncbi:hypothetical protein P691DRAFT_804155 [Macrolepiota fuliginosa MF-IS2]|uniref:Uncharacterized protein n=1 Tax=Macrolepiota fuliginosa MF-IS2 TaxID=1400762 RepID=A0A9P6CB54_9AGAR|nr:hypothetical protein P691DRAFT_804155 [Macrolepiota fuliginosa MF-IS2]
MDLKDLMANVRRMLEEDHAKLQQCAEERRKREEVREARRAERELDVGYIREELIEIQNAFEKLKVIRADRQDTDHVEGERGADR